MKRIPIKAASHIAKTYDYDQVVIIARKVGKGEHVTTYGVNRAHCDSAAQQGRALQRFMSWPVETKCTCEHAPHQHGAYGCSVKVGSPSCDDAYCDCAYQGAK